MIEKIDSGLLKIHQWFIDITQLDPDKVSHFLLRLSYILIIVRAMICMTYGDWVLVALFPICLYCAHMLYQMSRAKTLHAVSRVFLFVCALIPFEVNSKGLSSFFTSLTVACMIYFCFCDKPKPPLRKNNLQTV